MTEPIPTHTSIVTEQCVTALKHLVAGQSWSYETVISCYRRCLPRHRPSILFGSDPQRAIADAIDDLKGMSVGTNAPLLEFAEHLACETDHHEEIRQWVDKVSHEIGWSKQRLETLREKVMTSPPLDPPANPHLVLAIIPSRTRTGEFRIQTWFWADEYRRVLSASDITYSEEQVEQVAIRELQQALDDLKGGGELINATHDLVVVLFLPRPMLMNYVEHWGLKLQGYPKTRSLGSTYTVFVQSVETILHPDILSSRWLKTGCYIAPDSILWLHSSDQNNDIAKLTDRMERVSCLVLTFVPDFLGEDEIDLLMLALYTGIPVVLWPRHPRHHPFAIREACEEKILQHLSKGDLPKQIKILRNHNELAVKEVWQDMALLWNDPERRPRIYYRKLRAPR